MNFECQKEEKIVKIIYKAIGKLKETIKCKTNNFIKKELVL